MRFITEFELDGTKFDAAEIPYRQEIGEAEMGALIAKAFDWDRKGITTLAKTDPVKEKFTLEIEAFPMDKWIEFKNNLLNYLTNCNDNDELPDTLHVIRLIKSIEYLDPKIVK